MAALSEIEKLEARYAENPDGRYFAPLADAYRKAGQLDRALEVVTAGLVKHPDYLSAHIVLARCHLDKKDDAAAQASFEKVLALDGENIIALKALADIAERGARYDDARRWLMKLLAVDSMNSEAEEQLNRLGGPLVEEEAAVATEAAAAPVEDVSFADVAPAEPAPAAVSPEAPTEPMQAIELEPLLAEPAEFVPPAPETVEAPALELETTASFEETAATVASPHEAVAPAIDFLSAEPPHIEHRAEPVAATVPEPAAELPLIMPEDVTPAAELGRPTARQVDAVSPPPVEAPASGAPMVTETMGDLYLQQGLRAEAADVYRRLLEQRPDDAGLRAKLAQLEAPRRVSASSLGAEPAGHWLRRVARGSLAVAAPVVEPPPPPQEPSPLEQAFAVESEPEPQAAAVPGEPARPAQDAFSLDQVFGSPAGSSAAPASPAESAGGAPASFDEFFGAPPAPKPTLRPQEGAIGPEQPEDDLSAFNAWLHGLKK